MNYKFNYNDVCCRFGLGRPPTVGALRFFPSVLVRDVAGGTCEPPRTACSTSELDHLKSTKFSIPLSVDSQSTLRVHSYYTDLLYQARAACLQVGESHHLV